MYTNFLTDLNKILIENHGYSSISKYKQMDSQLYSPDILLSPELLFDYLFSNYSFPFPFFTSSGGTRGGGGRKGLVFDKGNS